jgi:toxin ParE1/3/4
LRIVLTEDADEDLVGLTFYTLDNFGRDQAERYIEGLGAFLNELPSHGYRLRPFVLKGNRFLKAVYRSHVVFVRETEESLIVIRILHDRMDPNNYLP